MMNKPHTVPMRPGMELDEKRLGEYLARHIPGFRPPARVTQFQGGQSNPTYFIEAGDECYVLRKKPPGKLLPSAHAVEREYRVMKALAATDVPVPEMLHLCDDDAIVGTPFYVMAYMDGRVVQDPALPDASDPAERSAIYDAMNDVLARLHRVDWQAVGLEGFGKPGHYIERQIARWSKQYQASKTHDIPAMDRLIEWLPHNVPEGDETAIAHGDYRLGNVMLHPDKPEIIALLDWELATLGHPLSDLAYNCIPYHLPAGQPGLRGVVGIDYLAAGIPAEQDYVAAYCRRTGREPIEHWPFFVAFALFRLAAIAQGVYARAQQGNASDEHALDVGRNATLLAQTGWDLVR